MGSISGDEVADGSYDAPYSAEFDGPPDAGFGGYWESYGVAVQDDNGSVGPTYWGQMFIQTSGGVGGAGVSIWNGYTLAAFGFAEHTFVVAEDNATLRAYGTRAGPNARNGDYSGLGFGRINAYSGPYDESFPDFGSAIDWQFIGTLDVSYDYVVDEMNTYADDINEDDIPYDPLGPNSNTYAFSFDRQLGFNSSPDIWPVPGWQQSGISMWGPTFKW